MTLRDALRFIAAIVALSARRDDEPLAAQQADYVAALLVEVGSEQGSFSAVDC